jgi:hypothetical protein
MLIKEILEKRCSKIVYVWSGGKGNRHSEALLT